MLELQTRWFQRPADPVHVQQLVTTLNLPPMQAQVLVARGIDTPEKVTAFGQRSVEKLHDPFLLKDMHLAAKRLARAIDQQEKIFVHGDYDVDGVSGTALMVKMLQIWGAQVEAFIPNRFTDGYGLTKAGSEKAIAFGAEVFITVDCGITAIKEVAELQQHGVDIIVTDHHEPLDEGLPPALAVLNPKVPGSEYPDQNLCGAAVAFKLLQATAQVAGLKFPKESLLRMVAVGTVADVVPLVGENRAIVHEGLKSLHRAKSPGLQALFREAGIAGRPVKPYEIGFVVGPRLNAAGRMDAAHPALELLLTDNRDVAASLAQLLERNNRERKDTQEFILKEALRQARKQCDLSTQPVVIVAQEGWHEGVIGIVASKLREEFHRPCIVVAVNDGEAKGSGRGVPGFHLQQCLAHCEELFLRWGGHAQAAGFTADPERIDDIREQVNRHARTQLLPEDCLPRASFDADLCVGGLDDDVLGFLHDLEPCGMGNHQPVFRAEGVWLMGRPRFFGKNKVHLRLNVADPGRNRSLPTVFWRAARQYGRLLEEHERFDILYQPYIDTYNGGATLTLKLKDIRPHAGS